MVETISKITIDLLGNKYEFEGGGGIPTPNSVGTEQIKDESVEMQDLSKDVKEQLSPAERVTQDELNNFNV